MTYVLALDCAMKGCGVAVYNAAYPERTKSLVTEMSQGQADQLVPMVQDVLRQSGLDFKDIALIATTYGPGSFTGIRIGLSAARSFALALGIPLKAVGTLDVLARAYCERQEMPVNGRIAVITETKRLDYYFGLYDQDGLSLSDPAALSFTELKERLDPDRDVLIGDAAGRFIQESKNEFFEYQAGFDHPDPSIIAAMGLEAFHKDPQASVFNPLYLRDADVSLSKTPQRTIQH
jgi:tRNA threonylcarbamoyladenosine biosynthesis protein TsaB